VGRKKIGDLLLINLHKTEMMLEDGGGGGGGGEDEEEGEE
jgi:hypothetical protein